MPRFFKPLIFVALSLPSLWWGYLVWGALQGRSTLGPDPAKTLALESGEWAIRTVVMVLAVTPLRYVLNLPWLWQVRRMVGLFAFFYAALHLIVFVFLYLGLDWQALGREIAERPYITVGFAAFVLLLLLAVTSFANAQRALGRNWKRLHRAVYLAAVLAVLHLVWIVRSDFGEALLYGSLVFLLLGYRLLHKLTRPVWRFYWSRGAAKKS